MKKIHLEIIVEKDKSSCYINLNSYRTFLNWGITNCFSDRKKARIFQTRVNTWINDILHETNLIYADVLYYYRKAWMVIDRDTEVKISRCFSLLDTNFNKLLKSDYRGADASFYALEAIGKICKDLIYSIDLLIKYRKSRGEYETMKDYNLMVRQLERIISETTEKTDPGELGRQIKRVD